MAHSVATPGLESFPARTADIGALSVRRILPVRHRRMVGPWCFFDRFGPMDFVSAKPMDVGPHPHIGLQTVSWLIAGEVLHKDSLGAQALLRPGELNLMTAGSGIAHSEETPRVSSGSLDGVQLWVALHDSHRHLPPSFSHYTEIPILDYAGGRAAVIMGEVAKVRSPAKIFSPLLALEILIHKASTLELPLDESHEHAIVVLGGDAAIEGQPLAGDTMYYAAPLREVLPLSSVDGARVLILGGPPFAEEIVMWWNFVARTADEIRQAREDWEEHRRFGDVARYSGPRVKAPSMKF